MTKVIGLTGGIASGKSTAVAYFKEKGFPVVDADQIARQVVAPGQLGLVAISDCFGTEMLHDDGTLNRQKLGKLIFANSKQRQKLDDCLAPYLWQAISTAIETLRENHSLVIVDIPLLFEKNYETLVDQVIVVTVPEDVQLKRLMARDHLDETAARQRLNSQWSLSKKCQRADVVFDNSQGPQELRSQIDSWLANTII